jgi:hypothetical protein
MVVVALSPSTVRWWEITSAPRLFRAASGSVVPHTWAVTLLSTTGLLDHSTDIATGDQIVTGSSSSPGIVTHCKCCGTSAFAANADATSSHTSLLKLTIAFAGVPWSRSVRTVSHGVPPSPGVAVPLAHADNGAVQRCQRVNRHANIEIFDLVRR